MRVVIAEKPSVARDLARVLGATQRGQGWLGGPDLRISWCFGHMAELVEPAAYDETWRRWSFDTLPMVPERFQLKVRKDVGDHWKILKGLLRDTSVTDVVNACDAGREGELIFRYVYELTGCRAPVQRLWTSSLTDSAIQHAWRELRPGARYDALANAARCRAQADWLVGLNATRAMTCLARSNHGEQLLSVGRVQTPTLAMIVRRDAEIAAFTPETFWQIRAHFVADAGAWRGTWFAKNPPPQPKRAAEAGTADPDAAPHAERVSSEAHATAIAAAAAGRTGTVATSERKRTTERPPLLYDLTALQRRANQRYGMSAKQTLEIAQVLYEKHKLITYPRTDARFLTPDQAPTLPGVLQGLAGLPVYRPFAEALLAAGPINPGKRVIDASEVGDHHAILPTGRTPDSGRLSPAEKRIFDLVARRLMAALSPPALFDVTTLVVDVPTDAPLPDGVDSPLSFRVRGRICTQAGWRDVDPPGGKKKQLELPVVQQGDDAVVDRTQIDEGQTRPPRHHNDASLLHGMETAGRQLDDAELKRAMRSGGLGTPATRAAILQTLLDRGFAERRGKEVHATDRGRSLVAAVPVEELLSAELTGRWEARLAGVAEGTEPHDRFMHDVVTRLHEMIAAIKAADPPPPERAKTPDTPPLGTCPICSTPVREGRGAYACETGRACTFVIFKTIAKRKVSTRAAKQLLRDGRTPVMKGFKSKAGKPFDAALKLDETGRLTFDFPPREPRQPSGPPAPPPPPKTPVGLGCPRCQYGRVLRGRTAWGCDQWRAGCKLRVPFTLDSRPISPEEAVALVTGRPPPGLALDDDGALIPVAPETAGAPQDKTAPRGDG